MDGSGIIWARGLGGTYSELGLGFGVLVAVVFLRICRYHSVLLLCLLCFLCFFPVLYCLSFFVVVGCVVALLLAVWWVVGRVYSGGWSHLGVWWL